MVGEGRVFVSTAFTSAFNFACSPVVSVLVRLHTCLFMPPVAQTATVTLRGSLNSEPFVLKRTKGSSSGSLTFHLNDIEKTQQSAKDTQVLINEYFGTGSQILMRTIFHGQHTIGGLLECTDSKLKEELSYIVSLDIWQRSATLARQRQRELSRKVSELEGMISLRSKDVQEAETRCVLAKEEMQKRENALVNKRLAIETQDSTPQTAIGLPGSVGKAMDFIQLQIDESNSAIYILERELTSIVESENLNIDNLRAELRVKGSQENDATIRLRDQERKNDAFAVELESAQNQLKSLTSEWNVSSSSDDSLLSYTPPETCNTCGQPLIDAHAQEHVKQRIANKVSSAKIRVDEAEMLVTAVARDVEHEKKETEMSIFEAGRARERLLVAERGLSIRTDGIQSMIKHARFLQSYRSAGFSKLAQKAKARAAFDLAESREQAELNQLSEALEVSSTSYESLLSEWERVRRNIVDLEQKKEQTSLDVSFHSMLVDTFGPKGVQAFVLRNTVQALQFCAQSYLDELSDGTLRLILQMGQSDSIMKQSAVRNPDGSWHDRPLAALSGGQWRRCSLSLSLGFADLASKRGKLRPSLLVLDEPLTHLDSNGRASVGNLLRRMLSQDEDIKVSRRGGSFGLSTILVILQDIAAEEIEECFDRIDEVVKSGGESFVVLDEEAD